MTSQLPGASLGQQLIAAGWYQGALVAALGIKRFWNDDGETGFSTRTLKATDRLVIATQTCDIKSDAENVVEAIVCSKLKDEFVQSLATNSSRYFVIDRPNGLVAVAPNRVLLSKKLLLGLSPEHWTTDAQAIEDFMRWLAKRYDRPALPDEMVALCVRPVEASVRRMFDDSEEVASTINGIVREIRISFPAGAAPPFDLGIVLVLKNSELSRLEADSVDALFRVMRDAVDPAAVVFDPQDRVLTEDAISVLEYRSTFRLFFDDLSLDEDAASPLE